MEIETPNEQHPPEEVMERVVNAHPNHLYNYNPDGRGARYVFSHGTYESLQAAYVYAAQDDPS